MRVTSPHTAEACAARAFDLDGDPCGGHPGVHRARGGAGGGRVGNVGPPVSDDHPLGAGLRALRNRTVGLSDARTLDVFVQRISDEGKRARHRARDQGEDAPPKDTNSSHDHWLDIGPDIDLDEEDDL